MANSTPIEILFNEDSKSIYSAPFMIGDSTGQTTITSFGLQEGDELIVEGLLLKSGTLPRLFCDCYVTGHSQAEIIGTENLRCKCGGCDPYEDDLYYSIKVTQDNPILILESPRNHALRLKYNFTKSDNLGQFTVTVQENTRSRSIAPNQTGCVAGSEKPKIYYPSFSLPCYGLAFAVSDERPEDATVELDDCDGKALAYLFPKPKPHASYRVIDCDDNLIGYAVNDRSEGYECDGTADICTYEERYFTFDFSSIEIEYIPTYKFPCEGAGYSYPDMINPKADVRLQDCLGEHLPIYIFSKPSKGITTRITDCDGNLIGFAVDTLPNPCNSGC